MPARPMTWLEAEDLAHEIAALSRKRERPPDEVDRQERLAKWTTDMRETFELIGTLAHSGPFSKTAVARQRRNVAQSWRLKTERTE